MPYLDPRAISGCQMWLDSADSSSFQLSGTNILVWRDKSGKNNNATVSGVAYATLSNNPIGVFFNNSLYITPYTADPTNETVFLTFNFTGGNLQIIMIGAYSGGRSVSVYNDLNRMGIIKAQVGWGPIVAYTRNRIQVATAVINSGVSTSISINAGTPTTGGAVTFNSGNVTILGREAGVQLGYVGYIHEIVIYNRVLSTIEQQQVQGYLGWKWNIQSLLPSTFPYRNGPPTPYPLLTLPTAIRSAPLPTFTNIFTFTGSDQSYVVPSGVTSLEVYMWGAGGGGGLSGNGGAGCYVQGILTVTPGETLTIVVGQGGANKQRAFANPYGGGGKGGGPDNGRADTPASQGGGRSAIRRSGVDIVTAGAGGGGRGGAGGRGGLVSGANGVSANSPGTGGTQSAGGVANGALYTGGNANQDNSAGGGSGYYGGGGGNQDRPGGGGSSLTDNLRLIPGQTTFGTESSNGIAAPQTSSIYYRSDVAFGATNAYGFNYGNGGNGLVVLVVKSVEKIIPTNTSPALIIIDAWYGSVAYRYGSAVTNTVNSAYNNTPSNSIILGSATFGDPQPGVTKFTFLVYSINGIQKFATIADNTNLTFSSLT
jgi:hypothetical protein